METLLQVLSKGFNTNLLSCQEKFLSSSSIILILVCGARMLVKATKSAPFSGERDGRELGREHEAERAHQRRLGSESRSDDVRGRKAAADALLHRRLYVADDQRPRAHNRPADDDGLGRKPLNQVRDAESEVARGLPECEIGRA